MTTEKADLMAIVTELRRLEATQPPPPWELQWLTDQDVWTLVIETSGRMGVVDEMDALPLLEAYRNAGPRLLDAIDALTAERDSLRAEIAAWHGLVEVTDRKLMLYGPEIDIDQDFIVSYTMPSGVWHRFIAAVRGGDIRGIVAALAPAAEGAADGK